MAKPIPIYRFLDCHGALKTLEAGKFRVGLLSKFNDPFEWQLGFRNVTTSEEQEFVKKFKAEHTQWLENWMGIICFSDSILAPVLWSLYAEKHRGVAFEMQYDWNSKQENLFEIVYSNERPVLDFNKLRKLRVETSEREEYLKSLLEGLRKQKSMGFSFEREYRLGIDLQNQKTCQLENGCFNWKFPVNALKRVILGFQCPLEESAVRKLLDINGLVETKISRAEMCSETYSIKC